MEPTIYKPSIYKGPTIYKAEAGGGGGGSGTGPQYDYDEFEEIAGKIYPIIKLNGIKWICENLDYHDENIPINQTISSSTTPAAWYYSKNENVFGWNGFRLGLLYNDGAKKYIQNNRYTLFNGWRIPSMSEIANLINLDNSTETLKSVFWNSNGNNYNNSNTRMLNVKGSGYYSASDDKTNSICNFCFLHVSDADRLKIFRYDSNSIGTETVYTKANGHTIRLCKDA